SGLNPGDVRDSVRRWTTKIALAASSVKASAISATTSDCDRVRTGALADARTPALRTSLGTVRTGCHSGAMLEPALAENPAPSANTSAVQSMAISSARGM